MNVPASDDSASGSSDNDDEIDILTAVHWCVSFNMPSVCLIHNTFTKLRNR